MNMKRKWILALLALCLLLALTACAGEGNTASTTRPPIEEGKLSVVATIFPAYDWARQLIGSQSDHVALTLLLDKGVDLHSYQPTVEDIYKISTCDVFIYVGGESDRWVPDALAQAENPDMQVICLLDSLGDAAKEEEVVEGMEAQEEDEAEDCPAYDEHVWLSLRNAQQLCKPLEQALAAADPAHSADYAANLEAYSARLEALDQAYAQAVDSAARKVLLFGDRFPFRYLTDDYGLEYYAAFVGCSAETEASFETVNFLVNKVDELALPYVMKLESSDSRLAETIIANTRSRSAQILEMNSLQSVTAQGVEAGVSYLAVMEQNLEVLKTALN